MEAELSDAQRRISLVRLTGGRVFSMFVFCVGNKLQTLRQNNECDPAHGGHSAAGDSIISQTVGWRQQVRAAGAASDQRGAGVLMMIITIDCMDLNRSLTSRCPPH